MQEGAGGRRVQIFTRTHADGRVEYVREVCPTLADEEILEESYDQQNWRPIDTPQVPLGSSQ